MAPAICHAVRHTIKPAGITMKTPYLKSGSANQATTQAQLFRALNPRQLRPWPVFWLVLCGMAVSSPGATYVNRDAGGTVRDLTLNAATWTAADGPYIMEGHVTVAAGATLAIEAGVTVQVNANRGLYVNGNLQATNTVFTINGSGNWLGIYLSPASSASVLNGCALSKAGADNLGYYNSGYRQTAIYVNNCAPTIVNCTITDSAGHGIELLPNGGTLKNNTFQNLPDWGYAIKYDAIATFPATSGNAASGTGMGGVWVVRGTVNGTNQWNNPGPNLPYYLDREINVNFFPVSYLPWFMAPKHARKRIGTLHEPPPGFRFMVREHSRKAKEATHELGRRRRKESHFYNKFMIGNQESSNVAVAGTATLRLAGHTPVPVLGGSWPVSGSKQSRRSWLRVLK